MCHAAMKVAVDVFERFRIGVVIDEPIEQIDLGLGAKAVDFFNCLGVARLDVDARQWSVSAFDVGVF
jgi:hypothetical protein